MNALVVYESLWGNTAAVARAIAEGIGEGARAVSTAEAGPEALAGVELLVAGAPLLGFQLPSETMRRSIAADAKHRDHPPDMSHPSMKKWLETATSVFTGSPPAPLAAGFETRIWWSPGSSAKRIATSLARAGCREAARPERFMVTGTYGPLKDGELERARAWGERLGAAGRAARRS